MNQPLKPLKWYKKLHARKGRMESGAFLVEGERAVDQIARHHPSEIMEILATEGSFGGYGDFPFRAITPEQMGGISAAKTPQGIIAVVRQPEGVYSDALPTPTGQNILLMEDIQDPGNVGTLLRTAAAFDFDGIILSEKCADPLGPKCVQASAGTTLSLWMRRTPNYLTLTRELQKGGFRLIAADLGGSEPLEKTFQKNKMLLALGNEAAGLSEALIKSADDNIKIPIKPEKAQSLNVAVCGAILMYLISAKANPE